MSTRARRDFAGRPIAGGIVAAVLLVDLAVVAALTGTGVSRVLAQTPEGDAAELEVPLDREAFERLGKELAARSEALAAREAQIEELLRSEEVLRRAGLVEEPDEAAAPAEPQLAEPEPDPAEIARNSPAFKSLQKAYANMEADSAAKSMAELAGRDKQVVVELLLGLNARSSGAILDALTQSDPAMSADLAYAIWKRGSEQTR